MDKNRVGVTLRPKASTWTYFAWLIFGGFFLIAALFMLAALFTISIIGVNMATQIFKLTNYYFGGAEVLVEPNYDECNVQNKIWLFVAGWWLWLLHMIFGGIMYITYIGRPVANIWFDTAKLSLRPFGAEIIL